MAFYYISLGRSDLSSLLLIFLLWLSACRIVAQDNTTVTDVKISNTTESSFIVSWMPPNGVNITKYRVIISNTKNTTETNITDPTYTASGLLPGVTYTTTISTIYVNNSITYISSGITQTTTTLPSSVSNFKITAKGTNQITLGWTLPSDDNTTTYKYSIIIQPGNRNMSSSTNSATVTGLLPGNNYTFTIYTVTQNGIESSKSLMLTSTTKPSPVTGLMVSSKSNSSVTLSWTIPSDTNASLYTYTVSYDGFNVTDIRTTTKEITKLTAAKTYNFTVYAVTLNGVSSDASSISATTLPPDVTNVIVTNKKENSFTVSWMPPSGVTNINYRVIISNQTTAMVINQTTLNTSFEATGLLPGVTYVITVYVVDSNGGSSSGITQTTTTLPSNVSGFRVTARETNQMTLGWTIPSDANAAKYSYSINVQPGNANFTNNTNSVTVTGLSPGNNYTFTIYTMTQDGVRSTGQVLTSTTKPSQVIGLVASFISNSSMTLTWTSSSDANANSYTYTVSYDGFNVTGIKTNTTEITNLTAGNTYSFTVYAVTWNGIFSDASNVLSKTTQPNIVQGLVVLSASETTVTLQWNYSQDINKQNYNYTVDGQGRNFSPIRDIKNNTVVVKNLQPGEDYTFNVSAVTNNGVSSLSSQSVNATTKPSTVPFFQVIGKSNDSVNLNWTFPTDFNANTYTYVVQVNYQNLPGTNSSTMQVKSLLAGVTYNFTIYTVTKNGFWSRSYPSISDTTRPNAPINLQGNAVSDSEIDISWMPPGDVNDHSYDYVVTWQDTIGSRNSITYTTNNTSLNVKNLLPGHLYNITVTSVIKSTSSGTYPTVYTATKSLTTESLSTSEVSNTSVTLKWSIQNNPNSIVSGYRVTVYRNGTMTSQNETTGTMYIVDNLLPGSVYNLIVESFARNPKPGIVKRAATVDNYITSYSEPSNIWVETVPDPVKSLWCNKVDGYQIKIDFQCPAGSYSTFQVLVNNDNRKNVSSCPNGVYISNLSPASSYQIKIMTVATTKTAITDIIFCSTDSTGVIVGSIFGILLFILLIALIAFFVLRSRRSKGGNDNMLTTPKTKRFHTIPRDKFKQHYENNHTNSDFGFADEYQELSSVGTMQSKRVAELPENRSKNRFTNVLPYDHSRVKLSTVNGLSTSDYINANYMPGYNSSKEFIASQGPLPTTTADFWRMVWEHQVNTIVMLTNCMENGRIKCEHYWPLDYTPCTYGDLTVTVTSETILSEWTIRDFSVKHANQPGIKYVRHFHFTAWPDHGVPDSTSSITEFRNLVREHMDQRKSSGPTVVHCSAGVGRTGTLIALDYLIQQMENEQRLGVYGFVEKMRMNRNLMVQTEAQYIFLNKCMLDIIDQPPDEHIYENHTGNELVYENVSAIRNLQKETV